MIETNENEKDKERRLNAQNEACIWNDQISMKIISSETRINEDKYNMEKMVGL